MNTDVPPEAEPESGEASSHFEGSKEDGELLSAEGIEDTGQQLAIRVGSQISNRRLDTYLVGRFSKFSRTHIQRLIKNQGVKVNSNIAKQSTRLNPGDEVELILPPRKTRELVPEDIPLDIIYEDEDVIVINKQADLIVHPARGYKSGTLVNALVFHAKELSNVNADYRPGIVHRLDRNTTGVIIVAKNDASHWQLSRQFADRSTQKIYMAVIHGVPELDADCINQPVGVHPSIREKMSVNIQGKEAVTIYRVLEKFRGYSIVELSPKTGRTHQLRVHMQYLKHSIVADDMYGGKVVYPWQLEDRNPAPQEPVLKRTALHAWKLEINHPTTKKRMLFQADPPPDMQNLIHNLRKYRQIER